MAVQPAMNASAEKRYNVIYLVVSECDRDPRLSDEIMDEIMLYVSEAANSGHSGGGQSAPLLIVLHQK